MAFFLIKNLLSTSCQLSYMPLNFSYLLYKTIHLFIFKYKYQWLNIVLVNVYTFSAHQRKWSARIPWTKQNKYYLMNGSMVLSRTGSKLRDFSGHFGCGSSSTFVQNTSDCVDIIILCFTLACLFQQILSCQPTWLCPISRHNCSLKWG
jgi:hypothetical protein